MSYQQFVGLSGLPRSGSTLLTAILSQNPAIHAEGNSAVCQLMWDIYVSYRDNCLQQLKANNKEGILLDLISMVPNVYYKDRAPEETIIVDKCRAWTIESNVNMLKVCVDPHIKIIVMERSVTDIIRSFARLYANNGIVGDKLEQELLKLLEPGSETVVRSWEGVQWAKTNNHEGIFLFVTYDELVADPTSTLKRIYNHCGWAPFEHDFEHVSVKYPENDEIYNTVGFHEIRACVGFLPRDDSVLIPKSVLDLCTKMDIAVTMES